MKKTRIVPIDRPAQLRALASPVRQEIVDALEASGPLSMAALGEQLGRAPDSLYFHVRRLVKVGLVVEVERRKVGRHAFVTYDVVGRPLRIDRSKARARDLVPVVSSVVRLAIRDYRRALESGLDVGEGRGRNHWGGRVRGDLGPRELARLNALLEEISRLLRSGRRGAGRQSIAFAWVLAPLAGEKP